MDNEIRPNDFVKHKPTGEEWIVCGVNYNRGELIPCGWPVCIAKIEDCDLLESRGIPQSEDYKQHLKKQGCESFIEVVNDGQN